MDKTELLEYYCKHYVSRQEILFKLPFNVPADAFWQKLVNRRKMQAVLLPLHNAQGNAYWYVMTEKMIKASEILCMEAMKQEEFDPYRMEMTTAMTWEMFFTSYVEGTQLDLDEAIDYLSCDAEPSNVREQILWNNRQAICTMAQNLFRPVDADFLLQLAYLLTQDLNETAMDYRQTDTHSIAAMSDETYVIPKACDIPERIQELCAFLASSEIHPLLKAAIGQAFVLATRPFPDGNERLARILSMQILYRSGYDYFRSISISQKIAKESYRYYKNMKELFQPENDADITGFVEYYIDLLARALTEEKESALQKEKAKTESAMTRERQMALIPLTDSKPAPKEDAANPAIDAILSGAEPVLFSEGSDAKSKASSANPNETVINPNFWNIIGNFCSLKSGRTRLMGETILYLTKKRIFRFTVEEWAAYIKTDLETARNDCYYMRKRGLVKNIGNSHIAKYRLCIAESVSSENVKAPQISEQPISEPPDAPFRQLDRDIAGKLIQLQNSKSERDQTLAEAVLKLVNSGYLDFHQTKWRELRGVSSTTSEKELHELVVYGIIFKTGCVSHYMYHIGKPTSEAVESGLSKRQWEYFDILKEAFSDNFTNREAAKVVGMKDKSFSYHLNLMVRFGVVEQISDRQPFRYRLNQQAISEMEDYEIQNTSHETAMVTAAAWA